MSADIQPSPAQSVNDVKIVVCNLIAMLAFYIFLWDPDGWAGCTPNTPSPTTSSGAPP